VVEKQQYLSNRGRRAHICSPHLMQHINFYKHNLNYATERNVNLILSRKLKS